MVVPHLHQAGTRARTRGPLCCTSGVNGTGAAAGGQGTKPGRVRGVVEDREGHGKSNVLHSRLK